MKTGKLEVGAVQGVALDAEGIVKQARRRRTLAARADDTTLEIERLERRVRWLIRRARRLPLNSNGRKKTLSEAARLQALSMVLPTAQSGDSKQLAKPEPGGSRHRDRAVRLLNELLAA